MLTATIKAPRTAHCGAGKAIAVHCAFKEMVELEQLRPNPKNPNKHGEGQISLLARIIEHQGWRAPITISNRSGFVVVGHGRLEAARFLGLEQVPVDFQDFASEEDEYAHLVADNRIAELAEVDEAELCSILKDLDGKLDLDLTGFDAAGREELDGLFGRPEVDAEPQFDKAEELRKKWGVERGQIWKLDDHRLMCGDSSNYDQVPNLDPSGFRMIWTDPPYGVSYGAKNEFLNAIARGNRIQTPIANDQEKPEETEAFTAEVLTVACEMAAPGASIYMSSPAGTTLGKFINAINLSGFTYKHGLVWVKNQFVLGRCDYHYRHEMVLYGWKENGAHYFTDNKGLDSVFEVPKPRASDVHPTMKPVELVAACVRNSSRPEEIVYEPFSGSGTTIIACEQLGRKCRAMEISPGYVAVAIQRWADATGKTPRLLNG